MASNVEQARIYGYETELLLSGETGKNKITFAGGYTFAYPVEYNSFTNKSTGLYLKYRRKHTLKMNLSFERNKIFSMLAFYYRSRILSIDNVFLSPLTREQILPGFYDYWNTHNTGSSVLDFSVGYRLSESLTFSGSLKNALNEEYMGRPADIQPPRNISLRLAGNF
jgi:iron complex outermembrane receptor protein